MLVILIKDWTLKMANRYEKSKITVHRLEPDTSLLKRERLGQSDHKRAY